MYWQIQDSAAATRCITPITLYAKLNTECDEQVTSSDDVM